MLKQASNLPQKQYPLFVWEIRSLSWVFVSSQTHKNLIRSTPTRRHRYFRFALTPGFATARFESPRLFAKYSHLAFSCQVPYFAETGRFEHYMFSTRRWIFFRSETQKNTQRGFESPTKVHYGTFSSPPKKNDH